MYLTKTNRSSYYQIVYYKNGKKTSRTTGTSNKKRAEILFEVFRHKYYENMINIEELKKITMQEFAEEYIQHTSLTCSKAYIERSIKLALNYWLKHFGDKNISDISVKDAEKFLYKRFNESKYSAKLIHRVMKAAYNKALAWGYIRENPFIKIKLPKIQTKEPMFITYNQLQHILDHTKREIFGDIFQFAFFTGLRAGEILNLIWKSVDLGINNIRIGSKDFLTKSKKIRVLPISEPAKQILLKRKSCEEFSRYIFHKENGFPFSVNYISKQFKCSVRRANLSEEVHFHTLRSSFGSYLLQRSISIAAISKLLGHSSIAVTEKHYSSLNLNNLIEAIDTFNDIGKI
jgi:integrase